MTAKEQKELAKLRKLWFTQKATMKQMDRCMVLSRQEEFERKQQQQQPKERQS